MDFSSHIPARLTRRRLLQTAAAATAACGAARPLAAGVIRRAQRAPRPDTLDPARLAPFVDPLPRPPLARPVRPGFYRIAMRETHCQLHRDLPPTRCWTYEGFLPGPIIEARSHEEVQVEWVNALPARHFLPIDHTLDGAAATLPEVRAVVHLHGARVPSASDGYPEHWFVPGYSRLCRYPNLQEAALLFYHDHAMGVNRLNVYAGLFGLYVLRDEAEDALALPRGEYEVPLVLCDRWLTPQAQLYYPVSGIPGRPWVPEVFGNLVLVNGKILPELAVEPRAYRFRVANTANARFFHLALSDASAFHLIGTDQGLLAAPVPLVSLLLAPAERADLVVDFSPHAAQDLLLLNEGAPILRFRIASRVAITGAGPSAAMPRVPPALRPLPRTPPSAAARSRRLTLEEYDDLAANPMTMLLDGKYWRDPVSETPTLGEVEIWEFLNLTDDTHPIHLHLVRFQILDRRPFDSDQYLDSATLRFTGPTVPPGLDEMGWKDTVRAYPGAATRIIVRFEGYAGRYLWHCHILEHEAKNMMRPYEVLAPAVPHRP